MPAILIASAEPTETLRALRPTNVRPALYSRHTRVVMRLRQLQAVRCVRAVKRDGATFYAIEIFSIHRANSRLPAGWSVKSLPASGSTGVSPEREPDAVVECTFEQLAELRERVYRCAQEAHPTTRCEFCTNLCDYILLGMLQPGSASTKLAPSSVRVRSADRFINKLLRLATVSCPALTTQACACQESVPSLLSELLHLGDDDETIV
jgi:hypothetical protein